MVTDVSPKILEDPLVTDRETDGEKEVSMLSGRDVAGGG